MKGSASLVDWPIHTKSLYAVKLGLFELLVKGTHFQADERQSACNLSWYDDLICFAVYQLCREFSSPHLASCYILEVGSYCYGHYSNLTNTQVDLYHHESGI